MQTNTNVLLPFSPSLVQTFSQKSRSTPSLENEEDPCLIVDRLIQTIQRQIREELGFREIIVATGEEADATTSMSGMRTTDQTFPKPVEDTTSHVQSPPRTNPSHVSEGRSRLTGMSRYRRAYLTGSKLLELPRIKPSGHDEKSSKSPLNMESSVHSSSSCPDCRKGTVYVSPNYETKARVLVIIPYREAGIWSRSICLQQIGTNETSGSMVPYLKKAMSENYGILIMNPAAQYCHPNDHVQQVWDTFITSLSSYIYIMAFSRGTQYVKQLLNYDNGQGIIQDRVKALALVEPSHYINGQDTYFTRRILSRRAVAWILSDIEVGYKIPHAETRHGCICISAGIVPITITNSSTGAWALEMVMTSIFASFAARTGEAAGITVNDQRIHACGICHRKLGVLNRRVACSWCQVKYCSRCCDEKIVPPFKTPRICLLCQILPCLITPYDPHARPSICKQLETNMISLNDFDIIKLIGRGACGRVKLVRKKHGYDMGMLYAMKAIKKKIIIQRGLVDATNAERRILDQINHPYIATLCYAFQTDTKLYLLSRYYPGGNLLDQMRLVRRFTHDRTRLYTAEVALAIHHLHTQNIIYRDLKLENVLVDRDGHIALTDFGMSKQDIRSTDRTSTFVGTYQMMAPELFYGTSYSQLVDWWALGVMVYEMIDGRTPFNAKTNKMIKEKIINVEIHYSNHFTPEAKDFVSKLLEKDETKRLGNDFEELKQHKWFDGLDWKQVECKQEQFQEQEELMKIHAKEFSIDDIFTTFMNTIEKPVDTPVSRKNSTINNELFDNFEFNYMEPEIEMENKELHYDISLLRPQQEVDDISLSSLSSDEE